MKLIRTLLVYVPLLIIGLLMLLPFVFLLNTSLKSFPETMADPPTFWPREFRWQNYVEVFQKLPFGHYLVNTIVLTAGRVIGSVISCAVVAWGFARYPGRWSGLFFGILMATMMLPAQITAIPVFTMFLKLGFYNTYVPLIFPAWLGCNAFFVFLLKQFFQAVPEDLLNAARIDGASEWQLFYRIGLPLCGPILWTIAIFAFIGSWNDYFSPLVYLNDEKLYPISLGLTYFKQSAEDAAYGTQWNLLMAASLVTVLPVILLFFFAQKTFINSVMASSLKQ
ncbi:carbohydrate ABC transporter permease [soil metagenome]